MTNHVPNNASPCTCTCVQIFTLKVQFSNKIEPDKIVAITHNVYLHVCVDTVAYQLK